MDKPGSTTNIVELSPHVTEGQSTTSDVALGIGEVLRLSLDSNPGSTGYSWTDAQIADATVVQQKSCEFVPPQGGLIGAPGTEVWTFEALKTGTTTITVEEIGPEPNTVGEAARRFEANVTVH
ncbi:protease inhibitor I42 family protein [Mycobacterium sp. SMC-2]|uniref:protease inhibitor I42 family protein n=1 Tax=Mycobacterium sp. SMC-2 TaxID=2857058 RepID=UPI0021B44AB7|nr:protease inhibitor I42 family protein [Mycobacterium sp. SMC-2]UXA04446.1 protease inhibitor I42 family protein [Mycobacterium sp. SMC-2]